MISKNFEEAIRRGRTRTIKAYLVTDDDDNDDDDDDYSQCCRHDKVVRLSLTVADILVYNASNNSYIYFCPFNAVFYKKKLSYGIRNYQISCALEKVG